MGKNNDKRTGCVNAILYSIGIIAIIGGCFCLPLGIIFILLGIGWLKLTYDGLKKEKLKLQKEAEEKEVKRKELKLIQENTDEILSERTLAVIENNQPIETLDEYYDKLTSLQRECTLNRVFEDIVRKGIQDGIISDEEEKAITKFSRHFEIAEEHFLDQVWYEQFQKLLIIKDILNGIVPQRQSVSTNGVFLNLSKGEQLIWRFDNVSFYEEVTKTRYEGGHSAFSLKIAKGVYYKVGAVKGKPVTTSEMKQKATGTLFVSTKGLYFYCDIKTIKIPYNKVVAFTPYSDGLGVQKDGSSAKSQAFQNLDGWFLFNIVTNISNL